MKKVLVSGSFDDLQSRRGSRSVRFLQEAARSGPIHALLWTDETTMQLEGQPPKYPLAERLYFLQALCYVASVEIAEGLPCADKLAEHAEVVGGCWAIHQAEDSPEKHNFARRAGLELRVVRDEELNGFPIRPEEPRFESPRKQVIVSGTFDWLHSGHVRFFEEVSSYGDLTVVVGHDANIELLKGPGHPLFPQDERLYMVQSIRYVRQAMLATGHGWLDAEPEIERLKPDIYAVNEDGDKPEKRAYCQAHGIEYIVLNRAPKEGLARRSSTDLRGF